MTLFFLRDTEDEHWIQSHKSQTVLSKKPEKSVDLEDDQIIRFHAGAFINSVFQFAAMTLPLPGTQAQCHSH